MTTNTASTRYKADLIADFIASHHARLKKQGQDRCLMVSMQGPQGCGKSTLAAELVRTAREHHGMEIAVASLDDFYLPYEGLKQLAATYSDNALLSGRGPPGTHDVTLLSDTLESIRAISTSSSPVKLPIFDKSLNGGYGDRSPSSASVAPSIDVFLLEGWSLGFEPIASDDELTKAWQAGRTASRHPLSSIIQINNHLASFAPLIHPLFDMHIAIRPEDYRYVYEWRLQQENGMKASNGGRGMTDEEVREFVDRYMPCYELYGNQTVDRPSLILTFGRDREIVDSRDLSRVDELARS